MGRSFVFAQRGGRVVLAIAALAISLACAPSRPQLSEVEFESGPNAEMTADGLTRIKNPALKNAWAKPDADFDSYRALMIDPVQISYKRKPKSNRYSTTSSNFALTAGQTAEVKRMLRDAFLAAMLEDPPYPIVEQPGPGVLRLEAAIVDLIVKVPTSQRGGSDLVFTSSTADMTLLLELRDSLSGEILARLADRKEARAAGHGVDDLYYSNSATNAAAVRRVFQRWARILRARFDQIYAVDPSVPLAD
jgi:hypothetical protein